MKQLLILFAVAFLCFGTMSIAVPNPATAGCCTCAVKAHERLRRRIREEHRDTKIHITDEMKQHHEWFLVTFLKEYMVPAWMRMTEQLITTGAQQVTAFGMFLDAKQQLEIQRLLQTKMARAHKDYHPSTGMCALGTISRSLANADRDAMYTAFLLKQRSLDRQLANANVSAADGSSADRESRIAQFVRRYCDINDNGMISGNTGAGLAALCETSAPAATRNIDISYGALVGDAKNIQANFTGPVSGTTGEDVIALGSNLFAHHIIRNVDKSIIENIEGQGLYMDYRSVVAKRGIAENAFHAIAGMKSVGSSGAANTDAYVSAVFQSLGVPAEEAPIFAGSNTSYYGLMETLAQTIYQDPEFFTNLYDKPMNVDRKNVAMQAIGLMLDRDSYRSELRSEAILASWLEMEVMKLQRTATPKTAEGGQRHGGDGG